MTFWNQIQRRRRFECSGLAFGKWWQDEYLTYGSSIHIQHGVENTMAIDLASQTARHSFDLLKHFRYEVRKNKSKFDDSRDYRTW